MIGLQAVGKPLLRAYSIASANYEEHLEFLSIKVPDGPLTSRLQHLKPGDQLIVGQKPVGTLVIDDLDDGRNLYLLYYPTVTREPYRNRGRLTDLMQSGKLFEDLGLPVLDAAHESAMICCSPSMLEDTCKLLDARGLKISPRQGERGDYVIKRAFVEK